MFHAFGPVQTAPLFPTSTRLSINGISAINILAALTPGIIQSTPVGLQAAVLLSSPLQNDQGNPQCYVDLPQHRSGNSQFPAGGNQVFCDGSAQWYKIASMRLLTTW